LGLITCSTTYGFENVDSLPLNAAYFIPEHHASKVCVARFLALHWNFRAQITIGVFVGFVLVL